MGSKPSPQKGGGARGPSPQFSAHVYCGQTAGWIKMVLSMEVGLDPVHIVLDGDTAPLPKKGGRAPPPPIFGPSYCGQTAGCMKMPLGMAVGLRPGDFVLDGDPAVYPKGAEPYQIFEPRLLWPNGYMDQDATWYGGRLRPTGHCARCGPSYRRRQKPNPH